MSDLKRTRRVKRDFSELSIACFELHLPDSFDLINILVYNNSALHYTQKVYFVTSSQIRRPLGKMLTKKRRQYLWKSKIR